MPQKNSILVVDDDLWVRESLRMILKPNYEVRTAAGGEEAFQCLLREKIDLITLDLKMPGLSGIEILKQIKRTNPDIEVVVISAYATEQNVQEATQYGAEFIPKPFNIPDLIVSINKSLKRRSRNLRLKNLVLYINTRVR